MTESLHELIFSGITFPMDYVPKISKATCPSSQNWDECFSMDFPEIHEDDVILLKQVNGPAVQRGSLKKQTKATVLAIRDHSLENKIEVQILVPPLLIYDIFYFYYDSPF